MPSLPQLAQGARHLMPREPFIASTIVSDTVENVVAHVVDVPSKVLKRASSSTTSSSSSSHSCAPDDKSPGCAKPEAANNLTMPIVLATVIPLCVALGIFFFLHRRHLRRLRDEDANDKHKSLDFGMGNAAAKNKGRKGRQEKGPEMLSLQDTQNEIRRARGMSMDMSSPNPYLLPPGLQASRESIHSLSRSMNHHDDRYRPATQFYPGEGSQSPNFGQYDDSSSYTSSSRRGYPMNESSQNLIRNAQRIDRSMPPTQRNSIDSNNNAPYMPANGGQASIPRKPSMPFQYQTERLSPIDQNVPMNFGFVDEAAPTAPEPAAYPANPIQRKSPPPPPPPPPPPKAEEEVPVRTSPPQVFAGLPSNPRPKRDMPRASSPVAVPDMPPFTPQEEQVPPQEPQIPQIAVEDNHANADTNYPAQAESYPPENNLHGQDDWAAAEDIQAQQYEQDFGYDVRRLTMGIRPLPPDDPSEDAEQRANRIRSFYREYFDDSAPGPRYQQTDYYDDYAADWAAYDAPIYDPDSGQFITGHTPYAEPITRRAMTPPPQGPPRFRGGVPSSGSDGFSYMGYGPRAYSSASGRYGGPRPQPKKKLPPPKPLATLPTPHMLKDDSFIPMDFAPPQSFNSRMRGGVPDSPKGGFRPYSPSVRPHKALMSSFDDLAVLPSPHALRKSGVFTSLDFAPPPRFKDDGTASDAGSIRSNRSGVSQRNLNAIRNGAFRLSRVPKDQVGTQNELANALKPKWDMR